MISAASETSPALYIRIDLDRAMTPDLYEWLLRPFWAEEYRKDHGAPGLPLRLKQYLDTRKRAALRLEDQLGVDREQGQKASFADFLRAYENGQLPIRCEYQTGDITIVENLF